MTDPAGQIMATCPNGHRFQSRMLGFSPGAQVQNLQLSGNREPCPTCGAMAATDDGRYDTVRARDGVLRLIKTSLGDLRALQLALEQVQSEGAETARPSIEALPSSVRTVGERALEKRTAVVGVLIALIALLIAWKANVDANAGAAQAHIDAQRQIAIEQQILQAEREGIPSSEISQIVEAIVTNKASKIGRNDSCPCGSDKKYKFCHGNGRAMSSP